LVVKETTASQFKIRLRDAFEQFELMVVDGLGDEGWLVEITSRRMGVDTGKDTLVHVDQILERALAECSFGPDLHGNRICRRRRDSVRLHPPRQLLHPDFAFSRLSALVEEFFHRGAGARFAHELLEEIGFFRKAFRQRQGGGVDGAFGEAHGRGGERGDAFGQHVDIRPDLVRREGAVEIAPGRRARLHRGALLLPRRIRIPLYTDRTDPAPPRRPPALGQAELAESRRLRRALSSLEGFLRGTPRTRSGRTDAQSVFEGVV